MCTDVTVAKYYAPTQIWVPPNHLRKRIRLCLQITSGGGFNCDTDLLETRARVITL